MMRQLIGKTLLIAQDRRLIPLFSYYGVVQSTFPLLPHNRRSLLARLQSCSATLHQAFLEALYATVRTLANTGATYQEHQSSRRAISLLTASSFEDPGARPAATNLVHLQTLLMLVIETGCLGVTASRSQPGPTQSMVLGNAVGLAYSMKLHLARAEDIMAEADDESDDKLARRAWWTLVILDRFHASSTASPQMIPDISAVLLPEDQTILGDVLYNLARKSLSPVHVRN